MGNEAEVLVTALALILVQFMILAMVILLPLSWLARRIPVFLGRGMAVSRKTIALGLGACLLAGMLLAAFLKEAGGVARIDGSLQFIATVILLALSYAVLKHILRDEEGLPVAERSLFYISAIVTVPGALVFLNF